MDEVDDAEWSRPLSDAILAELRRNAKKRADATAERDGLIVRAKAAGIPVVKIAEAVGLTRQQIHRIIAEDKN
jgi:predicted transcriptional regulator